jgi:hypothetical protein
MRTRMIGVWGAFVGAAAGSGPFVGGLIVLTWAGQVFLEDARRIFAAVDQAKANVKAAATGFRAAELRVRGAHGIEIGGMEKVDPRVGRGVKDAV